MRCGAQASWTFRSACHPPPQYPKISEDSKHASVENPMTFKKNTENGYANTRKSTAYPSLIHIWTSLHVPPTCLPFCLLSFYLFVVSSLCLFSISPISISPSVFLFFVLFIPSVLALSHLSLFFLLFLSVTNMTFHLLSVHALSYPSLFFLLPFYLLCCSFYLYSVRGAVKFNPECVNNRILVQITR